MRFLIVCCLFLAVACAGSLEDWQNFKRDFNKQYTNGPEERRRMNIFMNNKKKIQEHNAKYEKKQVSYKVKINHLSDMETEEIAAMLNGFGKQKSSGKGGKPWVQPIGVKVPDTKDWRQEGAVTNIKDQAQCGSCWAFSAVGSLEGQHFLKTGQLVSLSEQNLVDCSGNQGNNGCGGGWMDWAFQYVKDNGGIDTEDGYPYDGSDGSCRFSTASIGATCTGYVDLPPGDENSLKTAVGTVGPISVAIDAGNWSFQQYAEGVYNEPSCSSSMLDHGVLAVGYGTENGQDYWLVKNSWGTSWGESGYIKMSRNKDNQCGVATKASYPTM